MASDLLRERLPAGWQLGVTDDGRVFFIDDQNKRTTWLNPNTGEPVETGLHRAQDLPRGWEQDVTQDGVTFYVDHNRGITTLEHPFYGYNSPSPQVLHGDIYTQEPLPQNDFQQQHQGHLSTHIEESSTSSQNQQAPQSPTSPGGKENFKRGTFKQRSVKAPSAKRNPQATVVKRGWLHRLESSGLSKSKSWKKRWCVLADFALFIYKDGDEQAVLDSILLPSYRINPSTEADNIKRNFVFKVEHENTKTLYLAAEDSPETLSWMSLLRQAANMDGSSSFQRDKNNYQQQPHKAEPTGVTGNNTLDQYLGHQIGNRGPHDNGYDPNSSSFSGQSHPTHVQNNHGQSPGYYGYRDPASSPPYNDYHPPHPHHPNYPSQDDRRGNESFHEPLDSSVRGPDYLPPLDSSGRGPDSLPPLDSSGRGPDYLPPHRRDNSFRGSYSYGEGADPRTFSNPIYQHQPSSVASSSSRPNYLQQQQQQYQPQQLRDGFAPDSARNSMAQSDTSMGRRSYQPAQAERQRLQHELGMDRPYHPQHDLSVRSNRHSGNDSFQRDSYSGESSLEGPRRVGQNQPESHQVVVKQLRPWDTSFPDLEVVTAKQHGSYNDLLDSGTWGGSSGGGKGQGSGLKPSFNARSKSHENFSRLPLATSPQSMNQQFPLQQHPYQTQVSPTNQQHEPIDRKTRGDGNNFNNSTNQSFSNSPKNFSDRGYPSPPQSQNFQHQQRLPANSSFSSSHHYSPQERQQSSIPLLPNTQDNFGRPISNNNSPKYYHSKQSSPRLNSSHYSNSNASFRGSIRHNADSSFHGRPSSMSSNIQEGLNSTAGMYPHHQANPHTYVNFPNNQPHGSPHSPGRPPYPAAARQQLVEEMAQAQTPSTQRDFLTSAELNQQRMQQPSYFQYPSPRDNTKPPANAFTSQASMHNSSLASQCARDLPNSRLSNASQASYSSQHGGQGQTTPHETSFTRTNMMDPEAQKLRMAYERVHSLRMTPRDASSGTMKPGKRPNSLSLDNSNKSNNNITPTIEKSNSPIKDEIKPQGGAKQPRQFGREIVENSTQYNEQKSMEELNKVAVTPPPGGAYKRILDEPNDLYKRGSAFSPPISDNMTLDQKRQYYEKLSRGNVDTDKEMSKMDAYRVPPNTSQVEDVQKSPDYTGIVRAKLISVQNTYTPSKHDTTDHGVYRQLSTYDNVLRQVSTYDNVSPSYGPVRDGKEFIQKQDQGSRYDQEQQPEEDESLFFEPYVNMRDSRVIFPRDATVSNQDTEISIKDSKSKGFPLAAPPKRKPAPIQTVKEDPNMSDREILETNLQKIAKKNPLAGPRLRMSISAGDLIGKTHDELVLLLIQLRRNQAALEKARDYYRTLIDRCRQDELEYKRQIHQFGNVQDRRLQQRHHNYMEAKAQTEELENKLEVYKPIINLLDNMVTMGSLYGGDNLMLATQYRKHLLRPDQYQAPKKMLEFSRQHQERRLQKETEEEIRQLSSDEVDLEEKINRLNELDRLLQEQSFKVSSFREDKELLEKALFGVLRQQDQSFHGDSREITRLSNQQWQLEKEISRVTQQLAEASKELEETSAENSKLEHEVALLRTKVHGELTRSRSAPSLLSENVKAKQQMEKELAKVEGMMAGLSQQGQQLRQAMSSIRRSSSSSQLVAQALDNPDANGEMSAPSGLTSYLQTDLDTGEQIDLAQAVSPYATNRASLDRNSLVLGDSSYEISPRPVINHQRQNAGTLEDWEIQGADENTRRFFGLMPRDKPKGQTLREVKRLSEARKEREKGRRDEDESIEGQEIKLRVSNVDNEVSSIIHARIPSDSMKNSNSAQFESGLHLYENLPGNPVTSSGMNGSSTNQQPLTARRSSLILMAPKPFTPYQDRTSARPFKSELALNNTETSAHNSTEHTSDTIPTSGKFSNNIWQPSGSTRPYQSVDYLNMSSSQNNNSLNNTSSFMNSLHKREGSSYKNDANNNESPFRSNHPYENDYRPQMHTSLQEPSERADHVARPLDLNKHISASPNHKVEPLTSKNETRPWDDSLLGIRRNSRGRYLTISSSEPIKMEITPTLHSSAGDLILNRSIDDVPDIVKSSQSKVDQIDGDTIDREILYVPDKVLIPERYDAEADAEYLTEEEKEVRREKAERIRRVLTSQSVHSLSQPDVSQLSGEEVHSRAQKEKKERAHFLALSQELARQVTLKSKKQAAERRKTWSGAQFADVKAQYEAEQAGMGSAGSSPLRSPDEDRRRAEITLHDL